MNPFFYVIAIMGCNDAATSCAQARVEQPRYPTLQACQAAMPAALMRSSDLAYPTITAACQATGTHMAQVQGHQRG